MAKQSPIYTKTSIAVVALFTIAWSWPAFGQGPVSFAKDLAKGSPYHVFLSQKPRKEHQEAIIAVVQTLEDPNAPPALVFLQTTENDFIGQGMVCEHSDVRTDSALECHRHVGVTKETLIIGAINSDFCVNLRQEIDDKVKQNNALKERLYTKHGKNPIAEPEECKKPPCVCYDITHEPPDQRDIPPNSGSGTGGHN